MMRRVLLFTLLFLISSSAFAQGDSIPDNCEYTQAIYFKDNLFPRYEVQNHRLVLVDWTTGNIVQEIETSLETDYFALHDWSPDCRYLSARVGGLGEVIWDTLNNQRVTSFDDARPFQNTYTRRVSPVIWQPASNHALIEGERGNAYILDLNSGTRTQIIPATGYNFNHTVWSDQYLFTVRYDNPGYIVVYDLRTGAQAYALNRQFPVYRLAISPDGRWLAAVGYHRTHIWDMNNIAPDGAAFYTDFVGGDRRHPRFLNNTTYEIPGRFSGVWRYNLLTGEGRAIYRPGEHNLRFDETGQYAFVNIDDNLYLRRLDTGQQFFLRERQRVLGEPYWDYQRGWAFFVTTGSGLNTVFAYDLQTGVAVGEYHLSERRSPVAFTFSPDHSKIIVYTDASRGWGSGGRQAGTIVYDISSGEGVMVDVDDLAALYPQQVTLSTDNRYLVIGRTTLRVWDLQNLPADIESRDPIYRHDGLKN